MQIIVDNRKTKIIDKEELYKKIPAKDILTLEYIFSSYTFVIRGMGLITFSQFAKEIERVFDRSNPVNAAACDTLRKYSK